jgi:hypothetical protein
MKLRAMLCVCCFALLAASASALPMIDEPSNELIVQCGVPAEFATTTPLGLAAPQAPATSVPDARTAASA